MDVYIFMFMGLGFLFSTKSGSYCTWYFVIWIFQNENTIIFSTFLTEKKWYSESSPGSTRDWLGVLCNFPCGEQASFVGDRRVLTPPMASLSFSTVPWTWKPFSIYPLIYQWYLICFLSSFSLETLESSWTLSLLHTFVQSVTYTCQFFQKHFCFPPFLFLVTSYLD